MSNVGPIPIEQVVEPYPLKRRRPLSVSHPDVAMYWCWKKNCGFGPEDFSSGSKVMPWWTCPAGLDHEYQQAIHSRVRGYRTGTLGCPFCRGLKVSVTNCLSILHPELMKEWHQKRNKLKPNSLTAGSAKKVWWLCRLCDKEWQSAVVSRTAKGNGCPRCNWGETVDLRKFPKALAMFDKNKNRGTDITKIFYRNQIWWHCPKGDDHRWQAGFYKANSDEPWCPFCAGKAPSKSNNLRLMPHLAKELHKTKNDELKPKDIVIGSTRVVWWKCAKGPDHEWEEKVDNRSKHGYGCPFCSNKRISKTNTLAGAAPELAKEWHKLKNAESGLTPKTVLAVSLKSVWWHCSECGSEYECTIKARFKNGAGCRVCKLKSGRFGANKLGQKNRARVLNFLKEGRPVSWIAAKFDVSKTTVRNLRKKIN